MLAALIDKQPLPNQQWQISVSFTDEAQAWKTKMDEFIKASPQEVKNKFQLEATIMNSFLRMVLCQFRGISL